jgi:nucleotide-binding universal stress UspA family protein
MFRLILVPLDGTSFAEHAVPAAAALARAGSARLLLAHAYVPPAPLSDVEGVVVSDPNLLRELESAARDYLDDVTRRVTAHAGVPVEATMVRAGVAHSAIHALALDSGADLVVMASHDRGALGRLVAGSVAEEVARDGGVPVLLVRRSEAQLAAEADADPAAAADPTAVSVPPFRHLMIPLDGSDVGDAVVEPATRLARASGAAVTLVTVRDPRAEDDAPPAGSATREYLAGVARRLREAELTVDVVELEDRDPAHAITRCAVDIAPDVIAMGTHGRGALARLLRGSVAGEVTHAVLMPVLLIHPVDDRHRDQADRDETGTSPVVPPLVPPLVPPPA